MRVNYGVLKASKSQTIVFYRAFRASGPPKSLQNGLPEGKIEDFALLAARAARKEKCDFYVGNMLAFWTDVVVIVVPWYQGTVYVCYFSSTRFYLTLV